MGLYFYIRNVHKKNNKMKTLNYNSMKTLNFKIRMIIAMMVFFNSVSVTAQKSSIAVVGISTTGIFNDQKTVTNMVQLELEKTNLYSVLDKYEVNEIVKEKGIDPEDCQSKSKLMDAGKKLGVSLMFSGSVERMNEKIIISFRILDVSTGEYVKSGVLEFLNLEKELQIMIRISVNDLLGIENDPNIVNMLINYNHPIESPSTKVKLNGTRMGMTYVSGDYGKRMMASTRDGGYNMFPVTSMFGYQHELQYISAGSFQGLFEFLGTLNGLESGAFIPAVTFMNGFRFNNGGFELAIGPSFRVIKTAYGYYDATGKWTLESNMPVGADYEIVEQIDHRGDFKMSTSLIIAFGKTIRSGYLNIPVNVYVSPRKEGTTYGLSLGFNLSKSPR